MVTVYAVADDSPMWFPYAVDAMDVVAQGTYVFNEPSNYTAAVPTDSELTLLAEARESERLLCKLDEDQRTLLNKFAEATVLGEI